MSGLSKVTEEIKKKKLSLNDYDKPSKHQDGETSESPEEKEIKYRNLKKIKTTLYLTEEAEKAFTELYIHRLRKDRKTDRSMIACEAIQALFEKEGL